MLSYPTHPTHDGMPLLQALSADADGCFLVCNYLYILTITSLLVFILNRTNKKPVISKNTATAKWEHFQYRLPKKDCWRIAYLRGNPFNVPKLWGWAAFVNRLLTVASMSIVSKAIMKFGTVSLQAEHLIATLHTYQSATNLLGLFWYDGKAS